MDLPVYRIREPADRLNERWTYGFSWSGIPVGEATVTVRERLDAGGPRLLVDLEGGTNAVVDVVWRYRMSAHGEIGLDPFAPVRFDSHTSERGSTKTTRIDFDDRRHVTSVRRKAGRERRWAFAAPNTYDMISAVILGLNLDYGAGRTFRIDTFTGIARYLVQVRVVKRERVTVAGREHDAWRVEIRTSELTGPREERKHEATELWVSAERPRRLLKARSRTFIGAIAVELTAIAPVEQRRKRGLKTVRALRWRRTRAIRAES